MKIISIRQGFTADHSSTSYEFMAVDKALDKNARARVASLSSRARPTSWRVSFSYTVDGYDIPGGWEKLMERYYDVMYSESYDRWTLAMAFNSSQEQIEEVGRYEFSGEDDAGITINNSGNRLIVSICCRIDPGFFIDPEDEYEDEYEPGEDESREEESPGTSFVTENKLLNLLNRVRQQLMNGDYRTLYTVWEQYGYSEDEEEDDEEDKGEDDGGGDHNIPVPKDQKTGKDVVNEFKNMLNEME